MPLTSLTIICLPDPSAVEVLINPKLLLRSVLIQFYNKLKYSISGILNISITDGLLKYVLQISFKQPWQGLKKLRHHP